MKPTSSRIVRCASLLIGIRHYLLLNGVLMHEAKLTLSANTSDALKAVANVECRLLEDFPEFSRDFIHHLLLCVLNERSVFSACPALGTGNGVICLQISLNTSLVFEVVAAALRAFNRNGVSHG